MLRFNHYLSFEMKKQITMDILKAKKVMQKVFAYDGIIYCFDLSCIMALFLVKRCFYVLTALLSNVRLVWIIFFDFESSVILPYHVFCCCCCFIFFLE